VGKSAGQDESRGASGVGIRLRVVGCGSPYAGDDSVGPEIVHRLRARGDCQCELFEMPPAGVELLDLLQGATVVLFIDAVSSGAPPGTMHLASLPSSEIEPRALGSLSTHGWGLREVLELAEVLGRQTPRLMLLGVEVGTVAPGAARTPAVEEAIQTVVEKFPQLRVLLTEVKQDEGRSFRRFLPGDLTFPRGGGEVPIAVGGQ
jgi:hydrogenase maturation protease